MKIVKQFQSLCPPAYFYLVTSIVFMFVMVLNNMDSNYTFNFLKWKCGVRNCSMIFVMQLVYVLFWTWILDLMCKGSYKNVAWFFVLIPYLLLLWSIVHGMVTSNAFYY